jgi:hypothetical protein
MAIKLEKEITICETRIREVLAALNENEGEGGAITHELLRFEAHSDVNQGNFAIIIYRDEDWAGSQYVLEIDFCKWKPTHFKGEMPLAAFNTICAAIGTIFF